MDYEKKYKEALLKARAARQNTESAVTIGILEEIFPELAESEDEKAMKDFLNFLKSPFIKDNICDWKVAPWIAWLEKQGVKIVSYTTLVETGNGGINALVTKELPTNGCDDEQKSTDMVEPKFKVGDIIRLKDGDGLEWTVEEVLNNGYYTIVCADRDDFIQLDDKWELVGQKPTWSEEDEVTINRIVACLENLNVADNDILLKDVDWLKSLKERIGG